MEANISEWLGLSLRWLHLVAGISWIGSSFYFMWLDKNLALPEVKDENVAGTLWMVHSGGFYRVEKRYLAAGQVPPVLHWFKWEAFFTWLTGFALLILVYYFGGILVDTGVPSYGTGTLAAIGLGLLLLSWTAYDLIWISPLARYPKATALFSFLLLVGVTYVLTRLYSARAAYLHVGAILGTIMVANVWMRILPAQRQMIAATQAGKSRDQRLAERAKNRSVHNSYLTLPVLFLMVSHHYPSTYGHAQSWLILAGLILIGAAIRYHLIHHSKASWGVVTLAALGMAFLCYVTA